MTRQIQATITVAGDYAQLRAYRQRVNELLDVEREVPYRELHTAGQLEYRTNGRGVPYPPFVVASTDFPELTIEVRWESLASGEAGHATIEAGRLTEQSTAEVPKAPASPCELHVDRDGALAFAVVCRRRDAEWVGYVLTATQHAFFRFGRHGDRSILDASDGVDPEWAERWTIVDDDGVEYAPLEPREPVEPRLLQELDRIANTFADEWIWFADSPPEETAIERQHYERHGFKVNPANVRTRKLTTAMRAAPDGGFTLEMVDPDGQTVAAMLAQHWLQLPRH